MRPTFDWVGQLNSRHHTWAMLEKNGFLIKLGNPWGWGVLMLISRLKVLDTIFSATPNCTHISGAFFFRIEWKRMSTLTNTIRVTEKGNIYSNFIWTFIQRFGLGWVLWSASFKFCQLGYIVKHPVNQECHNNHTYI